MTILELRIQIHKYLERLSIEQLQIVLSFLAVMNEPRGILIVGREKEFLKNEQKQELRRDFARKNPMIQIRTYDSLIRRIMMDGYIHYKLPWLSTVIFDFLTNEPIDYHW